MTYYHYTVKGIGSFPLDMLRYNECWPSTQEDVLKLIDIQTAEELEHFSINITGVLPPKEQRWASFWCQVSDTRMRKS